MSESAGSPLLRISGLSRVFRQGNRQVDVIRDLDLQIQRGEYVAIMGQSGVGKSTLLHLIGGLDSPTAGEINVDGDRVSHYNGQARAEFRNRKIGFVFQFHHLLPEFSALENVMIPALIRRTPREEAMQGAVRILRRLGLGDRFTHKPGELSGGEQQRVALARALIGDPILLLLDEPTGNLDGVTSGVIHRLIRDTIRLLGTTCIVATHDEELARQTDRMMVMAEGRLEPGRHGERDP